MKIRKLIVISPLGLALLALITAAWWFLGDDAWIKGKIEDTVSEMTGRSLSIDGAFDLDWSTNPVLTAENIHFSNPPWAVNRDLARLDSLEVSVNLFSLFKDQISVHYVVANGLVVALEEHETGEKSWQGLYTQEDPVTTTEVPPTELPISVGSITLTDFSLLHEAPDRTVPLNFHLEQLGITQLANQQLQLKTDGRFGGEQFDLAGDLGPLSELIAGGKTSHDILLTVGEIALLSQGSIEQSSTLSGANIKLTFSGPEFEWLLTQLALPLFSHGDFDFKLHLQTEGEQTHLNLDGDLGSLQANAIGNLNVLDNTAELTVDVTGEDLGGLLEVVGVSGIPRNPFSLKVDMDHASGMYQLQTLMLKSGEDTISISGQMGDWPQLLDTELDFLASGPDLHNWGRTLQNKLLPGLILPHTDFELSGQISRIGSQPASTDTLLRLGDNQIQLSGSLGKLPSLTGADLKISADGPVDGALVQMLDIEGIPGKDFSVKATLERDVSYFYLNDASFDLAGNHLELSAKSGPGPELEGGNLVFSLLVPELSDWSQILQADDLPAAALSLNGEVSTTATGLSLEMISLTLGDSSFKANGIMGAWPGFTGTTLSIEAMVSNLADFRFIPGLQSAPVIPLQVNGNIGVEDAGLAFDNLKLMLGENSLHVSGLMGLKNEMEGSNFQTRMTSPSLARIGSLIGVEKLPDGRLSVNGDYRRIPDGWVFKLSNGSFAGASFESEGKYTTIGGQQQIEATSHVTAPNLAKLARIAGLENLPEQPVDIKGFARYEPGKVELRALEGHIGDSQFKVTAIIMNPPSWSGSDVTLDISGPDIGQLLINHNIEDILPFSLNGKIARMDQEIQIKQLKARLGSMQASVDGNLDNTSAADLRISVSAPSLQPIGALFDYSLPDQPLRLSTTLQGSPEAFLADQLKIELGSSDLSGEISVDLEGKPKISAVMTSNYLDLTWLQKSDKGQDKPEQSTEKSKQPYLIPDSPILLPKIDFADSDIELTINKIDFQNRTSHDVHILSRVTDGNLYLDPFQVRGEDGGLLSGKLAVEREAGSGITTLELELQGDDVQLGIGSFEGQQPDTIRFADIDATLNGTGSTYQDLARSLNGRIEVVQGAGLTKNTGLGLIFGNFIGEALNLINPFAKTEKFTVNECSVAVVNIESGMVTVDPVVSQTDKMTMVAKGEVDLHTEKILFTFNTKLRKGIGISASMVVNPFVSVTGTLQKPVVGLDPAAVAVKGTVAVATLGISLLVKSLADRYLSSKDPCGDALKKSHEQLRSSRKKENE